MGRCRPRFTIRRLMIAVAIVAVAIPSAIEGDRLVRLSRRYQYWAGLHASSEARTLAMLAEAEGERFRCKDPASVRVRWARSGFAEADLGLFVRDDGPVLRRIEILRRVLAHHFVMRQRFEAAAWRPWQTVVIDPAPGWER